MVVKRPAHSQDGHISLDRLEICDRVSGRLSIEYGRGFAITCLSKANLDEEALTTQKAKVSPPLYRYAAILTNHISHPNTN